MTIRKRICFNCGKTKEIKDFTSDFRICNRCLKEKLNYLVDKIKEKDNDMIRYNIAFFRRAIK